MRTLWTIFALTGFISISIFALFSMHHQGDHMVECLASQLNGSNAPCPQVDPIGFANFHSDAFKKISNLTTVDSLTVFYAIVFAILLYLGAVFVLTVSGFLFKGIRIFNSVLPVVSYQLLVTRNWFSLHENSPSVIGGR